MDKEQQIRLNFLDEAEDCYDNIESVVLGFANTIAVAEQIDLALRAAHSVKGGAGMMGFTTLSDIAHRLEDFFKILRVRHHDTQISTEVETLLLQAVDGLRQVSEFQRQGVEFNGQWLNMEINPIFAQLSQHLGELKDEDENALFNQNDGGESELLMFEDEAETILDEFEVQLHQLSAQEISEALASTTEQIIMLSQMANLEAVTQLCQSIQQQMAIVSLEQIKPFAESSLAILRRSHALVVRGLWDKLPTKLELDEEMITPSAESEQFPFPAMDESESSDFLVPEWDNQDFPSFDDTQSFDIQSLDLDFSAIQTELDNIDEQSLEKLESELDSVVQKSSDYQKLTEFQTNFTLPEERPETDLTNRGNQTSSKPTPTLEPVLNLSSPKTDRMVRVPVEQLYRFNQLFGKLIIERNTINSKLDEVKDFISLMRQRMHQLEQSNTQLRKWYDRSSLEGIIPVNQQAIVTDSISNSLASSSHPLNINHFNPEFDTLELDQYSDLHVICQEQIDSIVQLKEVNTDIELGFNEITQAMGEINQTTRSLQSNVTRTQMLPFADIVTRFPRVVRELSLKFGKQVNLKIEGESTLIDRGILETLNPSLIQLLRNALAHGIEDTATRVARNKSPEGTISIQAVNRGTETIITISDDGGGISLERIGDRLREKGISEQEIQQKSEQDRLNYIFKPGFSTADKVTELSGRGVGLDVVRTNLKDIRGDIKVQTKEGYGTTFILRVPFTLSILRVMLLERAGIIFAVSVDTIREIVRLKSDEIDLQEKLNWQNKIIPLVKLEKNWLFRRQHKSFTLQGNPIINKPTALVVGEDINVGAIFLDRVWGEREVTIYPIDSPIPLPRGFISSMVLGDGRVIPLVDPIEILEGCLSKHGTTAGANLISPTSKEEDRQVFEEQLNTILIVDDSINVRRYLSLNLEKAGYQVEQAKDGQEAVDKLLGGLHVKAVICDIEMPRLDGYGVLSEIKDKPEFKDLPILMLTSRSNEKHRRLALNLGASAYFSKPYNEQELLKSLKSLIYKFRDNLGDKAKIWNYIS